MEERKVKIFSYKKVWKVEKKVYSISKISLPQPVNPYDGLAFIGAVLLIFIFEKILPFMTAIPSIIRYIGIPYVSVRFLMKKKLDGKNPLKYFAGCILFFLTEKHIYLQLFEKYPQKEEKIVLNWNCSMGTRQL